MSSMPCRDKLVFLPFGILFATSFFLQTSMHRIVFYVLALSLMWYLWQERAALKNAVMTKSFALISLYLGYFSFSAFWTPEAEAYEVCRMFVDMLCILIFTSAICVAAPRFCFRRQHVMLLAAFCLLAATVYATLYYVVGPYDLNARLFGEGRYQNPIHLSILLSLVILLLFSTEISKKQVNVLLQFLLVFGIVGLILLSQTRSSIVAIAGCLVFVALLRSWKAATIVAAASAVCLAAFYFIWGNSFGELFARADTYRFSIWKEALGLALEKPWTGHGIAAEPSFASQPDKPGYKSSHNIVLGHLYHGGIAGLTIICALFGNALFQSLRAAIYNRRQESTKAIVARFTFMALVFCLIASMFNFAHYLVGMHIQWLIFWMPVALAWYLEVDQKSARMVPERDGYAEAP